MSNVVVLVWFILHDKDYPLDITVVPDYEQEVYQRFGEKLGGIIGKPVSEEHMAMMAKMLDFTNKMAGGTAEVDPVHTQEVTFSLVSAMSKRMNMPFDKDTNLVEGVLNHMIPLIQRINNHVDIHDNVSSLMRPEEQRFLRFDCIMRADLVSDWKDAVRMSAGLLVTREPVVFGEKKARVIFCLASRDGKEHGGGDLSDRA